MQIEERVEALEDRLSKASSAIDRLEAMRTQSFTPDGYLRYERMPRLVGDGINHAAGVQEVDVDAEGIGGVPDSRTIGGGLGITGGGTLDSDLTLAQVPQSVNQLVGVEDDGINIGTRAAINLPSPIGATWSFSDDAGNNRVDADLEVDLDRFEVREIASATCELQTNGTVNILNQTETGRLIAVVARTSSAYADPTTASWNTTFVIRITIDGGTARNFSVVNAGNAWVGGLAPFAKGAISSLITFGRTEGTSILIPFNITYSTSLRVDGITSSSGASGSDEWELDLGVHRAVLV